PDSKKSSRHAARRCASTPTSRDTSSKDSPRNSRNTTSILRFADHLGFDRKSPASSLDTDMSTTMLAPLYRLSNDSGCGGGNCRPLGAFRRGVMPSALLVFNLQRTGSSPCAHRRLEKPDLDSMPPTSLERCGDEGCSANTRSHRRPVGERAGEFRCPRNRGQPGL